MKEEVYKTLKNKHCFNLKEFKEEEDLAFTSKSPPMLFKPLKPLKEEKPNKEE